MILNLRFIFTRLSSLRHASSPTVYSTVSFIDTTGPRQTSGIDLRAMREVIWLAGYILDIWRVSNYRPNLYCLPAIIARRYSYITDC